MNIKLNRGNKLLCFFCCQIATLGLLRQTPSYSLSASAIEGYPDWSLWLARMLSVATFLVLMVGLRFAGSRIFSRSIVAAEGVLLLVGSTLTLYFAGILVVYVVAQALIGIGHAWVLAAWAYQLSCLKPSVRTKTIAASGLLAVLLFTLESALPSFWKAPAFLLMVIGSVIPLWWITPGMEGRKASKNVAESCAGGLFKTACQAIPLELVALMASYAMLFRLLSFLEESVASSSHLMIETAVLRIVGMALLLVYLSLKRFEPNVRQVLVPLLFLTLTGVALLPVPAVGFASLAVSIVQASWTFFYVLIWIALFEIGRSRGIAPFLVFLCGWTIMNAILLLAAPLATILEAQVSQGALSLTALALVLAYTFSVALLLLRKWDQPGLEGEDSSSSETSACADPDDWKEGQVSFYRSLADAHELTPRETDVFELLAQGYSLPAIEDQLFLSHSTVKGHARSVYRKFGVAGKQELIATVDNLRCRESGVASAAR